MSVAVFSAVLHRCRHVHLPSGRLLAYLPRTVRSTIRAARQRDVLGPSWSEDTSPPIGGPRLDMLTGVLIPECPSAVAAGKLPGYRIALLGKGQGVSSIGAPNGGRL